MSSFVTFIALAFSIASTLAVPILELSSIEARQLTCPDVQVYFARGTGETPTLGILVGPPFSAALSSQLPGKTVSFEGIAYPAKIPGYFAGGDAGGAITMANAVASKASSCPNTKIVMSGYSQGAQVTHLAARKLSAAVQDQVVAVVTFGDPYKSTALPGVLESRRKTFCNLGDLICSGSPIILAPHLTYGSDAGAAAAFVKARV